MRLNANKKKKTYNIYIECAYTSTVYSKLKINMIGEHGVEKQRNNTYMGGSVEIRSRG